MPPLQTDLQKVLNAVSKVMANDAQLFTLRGLERSITSKLASYIQPEYPNFDVDHEYNKSLEEKKTIIANPQRRGTGESADIVVHKRIDANNNHIAIEVKVGREAEDDRRKLIALTLTEGSFRYTYGMYFVFSAELPEPKILIAEIYRNGSISEADTREFMRFAGTLVK